MVLIIALEAERAVEIRDFLVDHHCGFEGIVSGAVVMGSIVSVATVVRTRVVGAEVSGDHRVDGCRFGGCGREGGDVGGCGVRLRIDAVGRDGRKDLGHKIVS